MDRLPWSRWGHWLVVVSLGTVWILDGLEVTIKGTVGPAFKETLGFSTFGVAAGASIYLLGAILGALFWGYLTDRSHHLRRRFHQVLRTAEEEGALRRVAGGRYARAG